MRARFLKKIHNVWLFLSVAITVCVIGASPVVAANTQLDRPGTPIATPVFGDNTSLAVVFRPVPRAVSYTVKVYRGQSVIRTDSDFKSGFKVGGLTPGVSYSVTITANAVGGFAESEESNRAIVSTGGGDIYVTTPSGYELRAERDAQFSLQISAGGGSGSLKFSIASGRLPVGLTLNELSGRIEGSANFLGEYPLIVAVKDQFNREATTAAFVLRVVESGETTISWKGTNGHFVVPDGSPSGTVIGQVYAVDELPNSTLTFAIAAGSSPGFSIDPNSGELATTSVVNLLDGVRRKVVVTATNGVTDASTTSYQVIVSSSAANGLRGETFSPIGGGLVSQLTSSERFLSKNPNSTSNLSRIWMSPADSAANFGMRITGYLVAPTTGTYRFWTSSDDSSEFRIATSASEYDLPSAPTASVSPRSGQYAWSGNATQKSEPVFLLQGQAYAIEYLFADGAGSDHYALSWTTPNGGDPVTGSTSNIVPSSVFIPPTAISDWLAPSPPRTFSVRTVTSSSVTLDWMASKPTSRYTGEEVNDVASYVVTRDGTTVVCNVTSTGGGMHSCVDSIASGTHVYSVVAVDQSGNTSAPSAANGVVAGIEYDQLDRAELTGDVRLLNDPLRVIARMQDIIQARATNTAAMMRIALDPVANNGFRLGWGWNSYAVPAENALHRVFTVAQQTSFETSSCGATCQSLGVAGTTGSGTRFAAFGASPFDANGAADFTIDSETYSAKPMMKRLVSWMLTGSATGTVSNASFAVLNNSSTEISAWLNSSGLTSGGGSSTACTTSNIESCFNGKSLIIFGSRTVDTDSEIETAMNALRTANNANIPILWLDDGGTVKVQPTRFATEAGALLGVDIATKMIWSASTHPQMVVSSAQLNSFIDLWSTHAGHNKLRIVLEHLQTNDWNVDLTPCAGYDCSGAGGESATAYLNSDFYAGARDWMRATLNVADMAGFRYFDQPFGSYRIERLAILLGDLYRRSIRYPVSRFDNRNFFRAYFADHALYYSRDLSEAQEDLGSFSAKDVRNEPRISKSISATSREGSYFSSATVYAVPGVPFTVTRTDNQSVAVNIRINSLRAGSTHEFSDAYSRPKFVQSPAITIAAGQSITISSPHGGPIMFGMAATTEYVDIGLSFTNVAQHPVWKGVETTADFEIRMKQDKFSWGEILTPGFEIHSTTANIKFSLAMVDFNSPQKLADAAYNAFYKTNYNLAGFVGPGLSKSATISAVCVDMQWNCESRAWHGIPAMNHFNSDRATCGFGCSGNPYDAFWYFSPLGWGDSHEMGHNIQSLHLTDLGGTRLTTEVSNNIFPVHTMYSWNVSHPDHIRHTKTTQQDRQFAMLNQAQRLATPELRKRAVYDLLWGADGDPTITPEVGGTSGYLGLNTSMVNFYIQLVHFARKASPRTIGNGGWEAITLLHLLDRQINKKRGAADYLLWKDRLGLSQYESTETIPPNDRLLLMTSTVMKLDMRPMFDLWGVYYSDKAANQVASYGYASAPKRFYYLPVDNEGTALWGSDAVGSIEVDGSVKGIPVVPIFTLTTPNYASSFVQKQPISLSAIATNPGKATFAENGRPIPGCESVQLTVRVEDSTPYTSPDDYLAICEYSPQISGSVNVTVSLATTDGVTAPEPISRVLAISAAPETPSVFDISKSTGDEGSVVSVSGMNLHLVNSVIFNGYTLEINPISNTQIDISIPVNVAPDKVTGRFKFVTPDGSIVTSAEFTVVKHVTKVDILQNVLRLTQGRVVSLSASVTPEYATNKSIIWSSSNPSAVAINASGTAVALGEGTAAISATSVDGGISDIVNIYVSRGPIIQSVGSVITSSVVTVDLGETAQLVASVVPSNATHTTIEWSSSNKDVIAVDQVSGVITGVSYGTAIIYAHTQDGGHSDNVTINVTVPVALDDVSNRISGLTAGMQYSLNNACSTSCAGTTWTTFDGVSPPTFSGNRRVIVRDSSFPSSAKVLVFSDTFASARPNSTVLNGVTYVSDLNRGAGSAIGYGGWGLDVSSGGLQMTLKNVPTNITYARGLGAHANSTAVFSLDKRFARFRADTGIDTSVNCGSVIFSVKADGVEVYRGSSAQTCSTPAVPVDLDVRGVQTLQLIIDANGSNSQDHGQWAGAHLVPAVSGLLTPPDGVSVVVGASMSAASSAVAVDGTPSSVTAVTYASGNSSVATVSADGTVTGVAPGSTFVTVTTALGTVSRRIPVRVRPASLTSLRFDNAVSVQQGSSVVAPVSYTLEPGVPAALRWSVSNQSVATVDSDGRVTGVRQGMTLLIVSSVDGRWQASAPVNVAAAPIGGVAPPLNSPSVSGSTPVQSGSASPPASVVVTKKPTTASSVAKIAKVAVPKGAKVTLSVPKSSSNVCKVSGGKLVATGAGTCRVTVSVTVKKKTTKKTISITAKK